MRGNAQGMRVECRELNLGKGGERGDVQLQHDAAGDGPEQVHHLRHAEGLGEKDKVEEQPMSDEGLMTTTAVVVKEGGTWHMTVS